MEIAPDKWAACLRIARHCRVRLFEPPGMTVPVIADVPVTQARQQGGSFA